MTTTISAADIGEWSGKEIGVSDWLTIDQERINGFADTTLDHQFIHVDKEKAAAESPFGGTIAHGFLSLSLLTHLVEPHLVAVEGMVMGFNYGFEKVRFLSPVKEGAQIRGRFVINSITETEPNQYRCSLASTIEIKGEDNPALVADWLILQICQ